jgi:prepilin-type N-terminal cleavage/methylation domain-containing protein
MTRLRSQAGFTLIELLVAMVIGMFTILAAFALIDATMSGTARVTARTEANQRGRLALDDMTRALRSEVCVNGDAPIVSADANQITFTTDLSDTKISDKRTFSFDPATRTISQGIATGSGVEPNRTFSGTFNTTTLLADVVADPSLPVFSYWADVPGTGGSQQTQLTTLPLPVTDLERVARIDITFVARPTAAAQTPAWSSTFEDSVTLRAVDGNTANPTFECP